VVHHALVNVIKPFFERKFIYDTYANRKEKGSHRALKRCTKFMRSSRYVLQCDVSGLTNSIEIFSDQWHNLSFFSLFPVEIFDLR